MEGIRDHPDFWVVLSLDGFGSHLIGDALVVFNEYKILVIKEEGEIRLRSHKPMIKWLNGPTRGSSRSSWTPSGPTTSVS